MVFVTLCDMIMHMPALFVFEMVFSGSQEFSLSRNVPREYVFYWSIRIHIIRLH